MGQLSTTTRGTWRAGQLVGLVIISALLAFLLFSHVRAQETLIRIEIDAPVEPVPSGEEFAAQVLVENVEHLAGFDFTIEYDPERVSFSRVDDQGQFLATGERGQDMFCPDPVVEGNTVAVLCNTLGPPLCLEGLPGASGSGLLGRVIFKSGGGGNTTLELTKTTLVLDDVRPPCDPDDFRPEQILHNREDASVELIGRGGGGVPWAIVGPIIGVAVLAIVGGGFAGFLWYRRRGAAPSP